MKSIIPADIPYQLLGQMKQGTSLYGLSNKEVNSKNNHTLELTTAYITTMYYSALSNLYIQSTLPNDIAEVDAQMPRLKIAFERSFADFTIASKWLEEKGGEFINTSPAKQYYDEVRGIGNNSIKNISTFYPQKT